MLVDSELAKEKLAKLWREDQVLRKNRGWPSHYEAHELIDFIRNADLSDCAVGPYDIMLMGVLRMPTELWSDDPLSVAQRHERYIQAADLIESLSAQVAELTKQAVSLANQTGRALSRAEAAEAQVAELKRQLEQADIREQIMIDEAKEGE